MEKYITVQRNGEEFKIKAPVQQVSDDEKEEKNAVQKCPSLSWHVSGKDLDAVLGQFRTAICVRNYKKPTIYARRIGTFITAVVLLMSLISTYNYYSWKTQLMLYSITAILIILFDVLEIPGRKLAPQSRYIISIVSTSNCIGLYFYKVQNLYILMIVTTLSLLVVKVMNNFWLIKYNHKMTRAVTQAVANSGETKADESWKNGGKDQSRALALSLGYQEITEENLEGVLAAFYKLGYFNGYTKTEQVNANIKKMEDEIEDLKEKVSSSEGKAKNAEKSSKELTTENEKLNRAIEAQKIQIKNLILENESLKEQNRRIANDNETLVYMMEKTEEVKSAKEIVTNSPEEEAKKLLLAGTSVRRVAELVGMNKTKVGEIRKELFETQPQSATA